ncbi:MULTISPECIES: stage V sporulation protein AD [Clostridium]|uniref:Stage V sporulation protein AD n=2 Tax=Clostridium cadaveris TaxID=1529 RepID=A0A316M3P6_9CLOT|nr:stage V sporulation protein AD [Clostridium cadaveris]MDU4951285.1 stage V sporulation protein AD [Clostridium sp.]MDM8310728.1 stage V sporulation protein AD [Clostridium cadaveris]MDY4949492.1 stage V sporulation protein AD [Clostridium cadaveris]NME63871.1 stage V sporulation protein AD [Clostridium cadaveris]NWK10478.1 stage V sporulation protein AD [Clostridium cadaveris]
MSKRMGEQTVKLEKKPKIIATTSVVGPKEGQGPLKDYFDIILKDDKNGQDSYEKAESSIMDLAIKETIKKAGLQDKDINYLFAGDLLNQTISSNYVARGLDIPFFGLYGACSTMSESLSLAAMTLDGGFADYALACTSSHFSSAERQYRYPLEFGSQRAKTAQWTVTGSGCMLLGLNGDYPEVTYITTGKVKDYGINDANNMGAAMAPAAVSTISQHFKDTGFKVEDYDLIMSGDLGKVGKSITEEMLLEEYDLDIRSIYMDGGDSIFDDSEQKTESGGSGCGCSAVVGCGYVYKKMREGKFKRIMIVSTGALMSPTSSYQGETIPGIAHAVTIEYNKEGR